MYINMYVNICDAFHFILHTTLITDEEITDFKMYFSIIPDDVMLIYIYIYIYRERDRDIDIYIDINIYIIIIQ